MTGRITNSGKQMADKTSLVADNRDFSVKYYNQLCISGNKYGECSVWLQLSFASIEAGPDGAPLLGGDASLSAEAERP
jgi:hypothetical protein